MDNNNNNKLNNIINSFKCLKVVSFCFYAVTPIMCFIIIILLFFIKTKF